MCQFNIIFVKSPKNKDLLKNNEYNSFGDDINNFSPFVKGICNCNSFVGSMCEYTGSSYIEMIESSNKSEFKKLENKYQTDYKEFLEYKQIFEKLLENENHILFSCILDEPEKMLIKKEICVTDIKIEDLARLEFNETLKIYKYKNKN